MKHTKPIPSQQYREIIADLVRKSNSEIVVEIGVYSAKLSKMLSVIPCVRALTIIDHWEEWPNKFSVEHMEDLYQEVQAWADTISKVTVLRKDSNEAAHFFGPETIDFWEHDGGHKYEVLKADIESWLPKVKPGGIMSGDNYEAPSVAQAVDERFPSANIIGKGRVWWARK